MGDAKADDHRTSMSSCGQRDDENNPRMGHATDHRKFPTNTSRDRSIRVDLAFCKNSVRTQAAFEIYWGTWAKSLNTIATLVGYEDLTGGTHRNASRSNEAPVSGTNAIPLCLVGSVSGERLNPVVVLIGHINLSQWVDSYPRGAAKLPVPSTEISPFV